MARIVGWLIKSWVRPVYWTACLLAGGEKMTDGKGRNKDQDDLGVPDDFPRERITGALPGAQPKFLATLYEGRYYLSGCTPPEIYDRWRICEDLAAQLAIKSLASKAGKRSQMSEDEILNQYYTRLVATQWTSIEEARWIMQKVADQIGWDVRAQAWTNDRCLW